MDKIIFDKTLDVETIRNTCKYCGEKHLNYACDKQLAHLQWLIQQEKSKNNGKNIHNSSI